MGDAGRNGAFSRWIREHYPQTKRTKRIVAVGDGKCRLANKLALLKYEVLVVEANPRAKHVRDGVIYTEGWFTRDTPVDADLVIGMHPDEATSEIILAAERAATSWAVVPCCIKGPEARKRISFEDWIGILRNLSQDPQQVQRERLNITGKNVLLSRRIRASA